MYLDNAATTPLTKEVKDYIISILDDFGNPSSVYELGNKTKKIIENARNEVSKFINADLDKYDIVFTSSGSSANALAILGLTNQLEDYSLYCSPTSHKSMLLACKNSKYNHLLTVDYSGRINLLYLKDCLYRVHGIKPIVCIEVANSEIGTINDIKEICKLVHEYNGIVIADYTGYIPSFKVDVIYDDVDILTFSGHKLHALKGVGILCKKKDIELKPLVYGSQEFGLFGGTENIVGIASLFMAIKNYDYSGISSKARDYVESRLYKEILGCYVIGSTIDRLPNNLYMCFQGIEGNALLSLLDLENIQVSTGSACNSGDLTPSTTLTAIGIKKEDINSCIRFTFSGNETFEQLYWLCDVVKKKVALLRELNN